MNIRQATENDLEPVLALIKEFQKESLDEYGLFCDDKVARIAMLKYVKDALILEDEKVVVGVIAGFETSYPLSDEKVFQEALWYVKQEYRKWSVEILRALEKQCKERGIKKIIMCHLDKEKAFKKFFENLGYRYLETHYIKGIE